MVMKVLSLRVGMAPLRFFKGMKSSFTYANMETFSCLCLDPTEPKRYPDGVRTICLDQEEAAAEAAQLALAEPLG